MYNVQNTSGVLPCLASNRYNMPKATDNTPSEADIIFNRTNVALARSQRLIQSWLPPKTAEETANAKTEEELRKEDEELFKPAPEL